MFFFVKKFISQFLMPVPLVFELFLAGCLLARSARFKVLGRCLKGVAIALFLLFGYGVGADWYIYGLERRFRPLDTGDCVQERLRGAAIVVLGQGMPSDSDLPLRMQITSAFLRRLQEGLHLHRSIPDSVLYVSLAGEITDARKNKLLDEYAAENALIRSHVRLISSARDTSEEARLALDLVGTNRIVLVTSASHMPRAVTIFRDEFVRRGLRFSVGEPMAGAELTPAPCDYGYTSKPKWFERPKLWAIPLPSVEGFCRTQNALYEGFGNLFETLRGTWNGGRVPSGSGAPPSDVRQEGRSPKKGGA